LEEMIKENKDAKVKIGKLNVDENQAVAGRYGVMSIPTFLVFKDGKVVGKKVGYGDREDLEQLIVKSK